MPQAGKEAELVGIAEVAYHSQLLLQSKKKKKEFENQEVILTFAKYTKPEAAVSIREDRNRKQTALDKSKKSGEKLKRK